MANDLGFDDIRFLSSEIADTSIVVLFKAYIPAFEQNSKDEIAVSEYYPCSNKSYFALKSLKKELNAIGIENTDVSDIKLKTLAARCGGAIGLNSIYYHETFGSYVCIQALYIKADVVVEKDKKATECLKCYQCIKSCPTFAISEFGYNRKKCLRDMMSGVVPLDHREKVYQLIGCDKCQVSCPMNDKKFIEQKTFDLSSVISGEKTKELKALCGSNFATRTRVISQAICYAVRMKNHGVMNQLDILCDDQSEIIRQYAKWAKDILG